MLQNSKVKDIAVVGLPDTTWGQRIGALVVMDEQTSTKVEQKKTKLELKSWAETVLPSYSIPSVIKIVDEVPRNAMGKVDKKSLLKSSFNEYLKLL